MSHNQVEYLIIGAGPAGLQLAYFLETTKRSYLVLEAGESVGTFFRNYPRHQKLISINKVYTGYSDPEINLRWDWNSLISADPTLRLSKYSKEYFPQTSALTAYLEDYANQLNLKIRCNVTAAHIKKEERFKVTDQNGICYEANRLIVATGVSQPYIPAIPGIEFTENYTTVSVDPEDFIDQRVLIIGKGNSGFETADSLISTASLIHMVSPTPVKMAWKTKYVGHLRAVNNDFLDTYQLKSQNGILDAEIIQITREGHEYKVSFNYTHANGEQETLIYDRVIVCAGFQFDASIFDDSCRPLLTINDRFPAQTSEWESVNVAGLYFAGVLMHMRDFKKKQSGFIHGFRHNIQSLHQILELKYHQQPWPSFEIEATPSAITASILDRVNTSAGLWQQTGFLCDLIVIDEKSQLARHYQDLPRDYVHSGNFGQEAHYYVITLEFGSDVDKISDPFAIKRVHKEDSRNADDSEFIHPIIRRYHRNFLVEEHHVIEDLQAEWKEDVHIDPLMTFLNRQLILKIGSTPSATRPQQGVTPGGLKVQPAKTPVSSSSARNFDRSSTPKSQQSVSPSYINPIERKRIGEYLIDAGLINQAQLCYALSEQEKINVRLGEIMVQHGWINQKTVDFLVTKLCSSHQSSRTPQKTTTLT